MSAVTIALLSVIYFLYFTTNLPPLHKVKVCFVWRMGGGDQTSRLASRLILNMSIQLLSYTFILLRIALQKTTQLYTCV